MQHTPLEYSNICPIILKSHNVLVFKPSEWNYMKPLGAQKELLTKRDEPPSAAFFGSAETARRDATYAGPGMRLEM